MPSRRRSANRDFASISLPASVGRRLTEQSEEFRVQARKFLVRHVASEMLKSGPFLSEELVAAQQCTMFFAETQAHAPEDNRDLKVLREFLERCYTHHEQARPAQTHTGYTYEHMSRALVNASHYQFLIENRMTEAAVFMYERLRREFAMQFKKDEYNLRTSWTEWKMVSEQGHQTWFPAELHDDITRMSIVAGHAFFRGTSYMRPVAVAMMPLVAMYANEKKALLAEALK